MVRTLAQQLTNEQQNAAGIGQHVDPVKRFVMINVLCVDREDEAEESRQHLEPRVDADEGINELLCLSGVIRSLQSTVMTGAVDSSMVLTRMCSVRSDGSAPSIQTPNHSDTMHATTSTEIV